MEVYVPLLGSPICSCQQLLHQLAFTGDAIQVADQQDAKQNLGIDRRAACLAVTWLQPLAHEGRVDVFFDEPQQVGFRNLIFKAEVSRTTLPSENVALS